MDRWLSSGSQPALIIRNGSANTAMTLCLVAAGAVIVYRPPLAGALLVLAMGACVLAVVRVRRDAVVVAALAAAWVALPDTIPHGFTLHGKSFYFSDVLLPVAAALLWRKPPLRVTAYAAWVMFGVLLGQLRHSGFHLLVTDGRGAFYLLCAFVIGFGLFGRDGFVRMVLTGILWVSAAITVAASVGGFALFGRDEAVGGAEATRYLSFATHLALACLVVGIGTWIVERRTSWPLVVPALPIVVLSFSRNSLLAVAVGTVFALVACRAVGGALRLAAAGVVLVALALGATAIGSDLPGAQYASKQLTAYRVRVIDGLRGGNMQNDTSVQWRETESVYAHLAFPRHRVIGAGIGTDYRPPLGRTGTFQGDGRYYIHNGYWWILLKLGSVGLALFLWFVSPLVRVRGAAIPWAAGAVGLLAVNFVAPMVTDAAGAPVLGLLVGLVSAGTLSASGVSGETHIDEPQVT